MCIYILHIIYIILYIYILATAVAMAVFSMEKKIG